VGSFHVYVLRSQVDGGFYVGLTADVHRRLGQHNAGQQRSTKARRPFELWFSERFETRAEAREREKFWKSGRGRELLKRRLG